MYLDLFRLDGRFALVTGGGRGIGLSCAEALAEAGARVVIADQDEELLETAGAAMRAKGYDVGTEQMDVTDSARVTAIADAYAQGGAPIDILVNNAGIARSETPAEAVTDEHWLNVLDVNLNGTFWCCRAFGRHMLATGKGAIVNVGSMSGFIVNKPQEQSYYNASNDRSRRSGRPGAFG
jgi:NAD(P)-dependent dehydrogenase (short-subunit alcohol dehydrogenase family)